MKRSFEEMLSRVREAENHGFHAAALQLLEEAVAAYPDRRSNLSLSFAENRRLLGRFSEALESLENSKDIPEKKLWLHILQRGQIALDQGRLAKAEEYFRGALALKPNLTVCYCFLGTCLRLQERFDESSAVLLKGMETEGDRDEVALNLGLTFRSAGKFELALKYFEIALSLDSSEMEGRRYAEDLRSIGVVPAE